MTDDISDKFSSAIESLSKRLDTSNNLLAMSNMYALERMSARMDSSVISRDQESQERHFSVLEEILSTQKSILEVQRNQLDFSRESAQDAERRSRLNPGDRGRGFRDSLGSSFGSSLGSSAGSLIGGGFGIGGLLTGLGSGIGRSAGSIAGIGIGIAGFFTALAGADWAIKKLGNGENLAELMGNVGAGIAALPTSAMVGLGALVASQLFLPSKAFGSQVRMATGMTAIGAGIGGFFTGLALADSASTWMSADLSGFKEKMTNLAGGLDALSQGNGLVALGALAGSGLFAITTGLGTQFKLATGMTLIGAGIGGFFAGLASAMSIPDLLSIDTNAVKTMLTNLGEGLNAFNTQSLTALGGMLGAGALFGVVGGPGVAGMAAVGLTLVGLGIGGFLAAIDGVLAGASAIGIDGSSTKTLLQNIASGLVPLSDLNADNLTAMGDALVSIGAGLAAFLGADALGKVTGLAGAGFDVLQDSVNWLFGSDLGSNPQPSVIETIVNSLSPLADLDMSLISKMDTLGAAIGRFTAAFEDLNSIDTGATSSKLTRMIADMGGVLDLLPYLMNGGTYYSSDSNSLSRLLGTGRGEISFGPEGTGLNNLADADLNALADGINALRSALGATAEIIPAPTASSRSDALTFESAQISGAQFMTMSPTTNNTDARRINNTNNTFITTTNPLAGVDRAVPQ